MASQYAPEERGKSYCSEAVKIMVDYLFLSNSIDRIQAVADTRNLPSRRVLEELGFMKESLLRKSAFIKGDWRDLFIYARAFSKKNEMNQKY